MRKITSTTELREAIFLLETKQANEARLLKEQFMITYESFKPVNLIKNSINELITSPQLKGNILNTTIGLAAGYLSKRVAVGSTHNPLKQLLGTFLKFGVTNIVSKNTDGIKSTVMSLISNFLNKNRSTD